MRLFLLVAYVLLLIFLQWEVALKLAMLDAVLMEYVLVYQLFATVIPLVSNLMIAAQTSLTFVRIFVHASTVVQHTEVHTCTSSHTHTHARTHARTRAHTHPHTDQPVPISNLDVDIISATAMNISWTQPPNPQVCQDAYTRIEILTYGGSLVLNDTVQADVTFLYVDENLGINVHTHACTGTCTHRHMHAPMHTHTHTHIHTERFIPYQIFVTATIILGSDEPLTTIAFTEEGSKSPMTFPAKNCFNFLPHYYSASNFT